MKIQTFDQGSPEWLSARLARPTMSRNDSILTPKSRKPSTARFNYKAELVAEYLLGQPLESNTNAWMERGTDLEAEARKYYEFSRDVEVQQVGFIERDDGLAGGSPDGLVGDDGVLEIKCPAAIRHVRYMLGEEPDYVGQVQGYMYLTGRSWCDVLSYNPDLPAVVIRVERDSDYIAAFVPVLNEFIEKLEADKARLAHHKIERPWDEHIQAEMKEANK